MLELRPYQATFEAKLHTAWQQARAVMGVSPTGSGKTITFSSLVHDHNGAAAVVVHRKEIIRQISLALAQLEVRHRIVAPPDVVRSIRRRHLKVLGRSYVDPLARVGVVSVQTLTSKSSGRNRDLQRWLTQVTLAVFDEGHHYVATGLWGTAVHKFDRAKLLFVTATPQRADGKGLGVHADGFAEAMVEGPSTKWLIEHGYLCKYRYYCPETDLDVSDLAVGASGDFTSQTVRKRIVESGSHIVGDVVTHYMRYAAGKQAIVFASDVVTAGEMALAFQAHGIRACALSGETDATERDSELEHFEARHLQVLINVDLFDEGFDVPGVEAVIMARPTWSLAKFLQMIGRCLRPAPGKAYATVIDAVRNWERGHGMPDWPRVWSLDRRTGASRGADDTIPQRICKGCTQPYEAFYKVCPYQITPECAQPPVPAERQRPSQVDGDLMELDVEALAALYAQIARADMSDDDYELDMIARNVPPIARGAGLRRHQTARYRRAVLHELVAWWVGMQPARELAEKHRRFYHRFGIDIGTAFTLDARDTDALIERIGQRFTEDMTP